MGCKRFNKFRNWNKKIYFVLRHSEKNLHHWNGDAKWLDDFIKNNKEFQQ
jgi:hypothetical protein